MKRGLHILWLTILANVLVASSMAQNLPPDKWWRKPEMIRSLDLQKDQTERIEAIFRQNTKMVIDHKAEVEKAQFDLGLLLENEPVDKEKVMTQAALLETARSKMARTMTSILVDVRKVLTLDQWKKLQELRPLTVQERLENKRRMESRTSPLRPGAPKLP